MLEKKSILRQRAVYQAMFAFTFLVILLAGTSTNAATSAFNAAHTALTKSVYKAGDVISFSSRVRVLTGSGQYIVALVVKDSSGKTVGDKYYYHQQMSSLLAKTYSDFKFTVPTGAAGSFSYKAFVFGFDWSPMVVNQTAIQFSVLATNNAKDVFATNVELEKSSYNKGETVSLISRIRATSGSGTYRIKTIVMNAAGVEVAGKIHENQTITSTSSLALPAFNFAIPSTSTGSYSFKVAAFNYSGIGLPVRQTASPIRVNISSTPPPNPGDDPPQFAKLESCQLSTDPSSLVGTCGDRPAPNIPMPLLFDGTTNTKYTSLFGAKFMRISEPKNVVDTNITQMYPDYAKVPAWNSDGSRMWLFSNNGFVNILNGKTYAYIETLTSAKNFIYSGLDANPRWSHSDPNILYYVSRMSLIAYNVSTHEGTVVHTFTQSETGLACTDIGMGDEGNPDNTDRYWAFYCQNAAYAQQGVIVYDKQANQVIKVKSFKAGGVCGVNACPTSVNWLGMSHSGNHVAINWNADATDGVFTVRGQGQESFDRNLNYLSKSSEKNWHSDVAQMANGTDVFVGASHLNETNGYRAIRAVRLSDGAIMKSCMVPDLLSWHVSGRTDINKMKGWVLYSTYDQTGRSLGDGVFGTEIFALNIDTCKVRRIAHAQSYWHESYYFSEPHAVMNFDFTKVLWGSNWRVQRGVEQSYVSELGP